MSVPPELSRTVRTRAMGRCQYCRMHESLQGATFHVEHVIPQSKGGFSELTNLVLACPSCNLHKSNRVTATDLESARTVPLFHPIQQRWSEHFRFTAYEIVGLTDTGRATVEALKMNHPRRLRIRSVEEAFALFPPNSEE